MSRAARIVAIAITTSVAAILLFPVFLAVRAAGSAVFEPERMDFVLLGAAAFGITIGLQVVPSSGGRRIALLALFASAALLFGFMAVFSIGLAILPVGLLLIVVLYRALLRDPAVTRPAALGGAAIGYSSVLLFIALLVPATAECFPNGAGTSSGRWRGSGQQQYSGGSGGVGGQPGVFTGYAEYSDSVVTFRCEGGRLVEFQRTPR